MNKRGPKNVVKRDDAINFLVSTGLTFNGKPRYSEYGFSDANGVTKTFTLKAMRREYIKAKTPATPTDATTAPVVA